MMGRALVIATTSIGAGALTLFAVNEATDNPRIAVVASVAAQVLAIYLVLRYA